MAVYEVSVNLSSSLFAFASELWGRSIMFPQLDENYNRTIFSTIDPGFEKQVPQVYYMHNVMPTIEGYQSVGFEQVIAPSVPFDSQQTFNAAFQIQTVSLNNFLFVPAAGANVIYRGDTQKWKVTTPVVAGVTQDTQVTTAFVHGETYIYYSGVGCFKYNDFLDTMTPVTLTGLDPTKILAIAAANGYMIAVSNNAVAWSSLVDPTDFTPSLITGAGGGSVNDAAGPIITVLKITGGFIIYCEFNAVGATYTGNSNFPFLFLEVAESGGINTVEQVTYHANLGYHIMLGSYGIQQVNKTSAKSVYPEASDFLSAKIFEDFNEISLQLSSFYLNQELFTKVHIIQARFLVISYGRTDKHNFTHALVHDLVMKRWGKLKINHVDCFEWNDPNTFTFDGAGVIVTQGPSEVQPRKSIAFLQRDGTTFLVNFDLQQKFSDGVFIIGKFQFMRRKWIEHQYGTVDSVTEGNTFNYYVLPSFDGKTLQSPISARKNEKLSGIKSQTFQRLVSGLNISILFVGKFNLTTQLFAFTTGGAR